MYITKNNLLVDVLNLRIPFHIAGSCKKDPNKHNQKESFS